MPTSGKRKIERSLVVFIVTSKYADFDGGVGTRPPDPDDDDDDDVWQVSARSVSLQHSVLQYFRHWWFLSLFLILYVKLLVTISKHSIPLKNENVRLVYFKTREISVALQIQFKPIPAHGSYSM